MPIIVGDLVDLHVKAVIAAMRKQPALIDAAHILTSPVTLTACRIEAGGMNIAPGRGWLRRLAPDGWADAMAGPGASAAARAAAMSALAAIARDERFSWLTPLDRLGAAENKPYQYRRAVAAGVPVPDWVVTTDRNAVPRSGRWVSKPLGPGSFIDGGGQGWIVPTSVANLEDPATIARVPFLLQQRVDAVLHARVVTIERNVYSATLPATDLPMDWRLSEAGHAGFIPTPAPDRVHKLAVAAAASVGAGYSAQDWIQDAEDAWWFVDLNPAGQWLFLPEEVSAQVTAAIARFLEGP